MPYELFIALRYLRAKRRQSAVSVITAIATIGISVGVAALIVAQALITGFRSDVQEKILRGTAHLNLLREDNGGIDNYTEIESRIRQIPGIKAVSSTIYTPVLLSAGDRQEQVIIKGLDLASPEERRDLKASLVEGSEEALVTRGTASSSPEQEEESPSRGILLGQQLARTMGLKINDAVTAVSAATRLTPAGLQNRPKYTRFHVAGTFSSGLYEYDSKWAYVSLDASQRLSGMPGAVGVIQMKVDSIYAVDELGSRVRALAGEGFMTTNWQELNRPLFTALALQHRVVIVFFILLVAIAALNIITTLLMMVTEKHRDIAILRAQGSTPQAVLKIFLFQGLVIGIAGALAGLSLGTGLCWLANRYQLISLPAEFYSISHVSLQVRFLDCLLFCSLAVVICLLATIYPARMASRLAPADALRYE
jgi:lipoprotein-releasing system permease protein